MNQALFSFFYTLAHKSTAIDSTIVFFAVDLIWVILIAIFFYLFKNKNKRSMFRDLGIFFAAAIGAVAIATLFKDIFRTSRPLVQTLFTETGYAFPSEHTMILFAIAGALWFNHRTAAIWAGIGALIVGLARISAGVHWPIDIVGGIVLGSAVGVCVYRLAERLLPNVKKSIY